VSLLSSCVTPGLTFEGNSFEWIGGNAVFLSASVRNVSVHANVFQFLGTSGVAVQVRSNPPTPLLRNSSVLQLYRWPLKGAQCAGAPLLPWRLRPAAWFSPAAGRGLCWVLSCRLCAQGKTGDAMMDGRDGERMMAAHGPCHSRAASFGCTRVSASDVFFS